ncbi:hypothetical protein AB6A40_003181 [Gnathostoma spinigerum]|uniref:Uncharacterized protein n=1 Tax=Gnathostoma spinigerum TaxID=75299 RepID=A0ABD6EIH0_9BILA
MVSACPWTVSDILEELFARIGMEETARDIYLLLFTLTVVVIAIILILVIFIKDKLCPRKSIYSTVDRNQIDVDGQPTPKVIKYEINAQSANPSGRRKSSDHYKDVDYIDEKIAHVIPSSVTVNSLHNSRVLIT